METENTPVASTSGFHESASIIVTDSFEAVLFPSGVLLAQGDNIIRLGPEEAMAIAGAVMLMATGDEGETEAASDSE